MVTSSDDIAELKRRRVCAACIGEAFLKQQISAEGTRRRCTYCRKTDATIGLGELSERVSAAFQGHYQRTSTEPNSLEYLMLSDKEADYSWYRKGDPVIDAIAMALECDEEIARDVQAILEDEHSPAPGDYIGEEQEFDGESHYAPISPQDHVWQREWDEFERSLKTESRYFSQSAAAHLEKVFRGLDAMRTSDGRSAIVSAGPGTDTTAFYRARVFESWLALEPAVAEPDKHIGPPPSSLARSGRMNAQGISVFYGSSAPDAALAEVRPPVGSDVVVVRFTLQRAVRLLDLRSLTDLQEEGSIFDATLAWRRERAVFFKRLTRRITMPVMPSDEASGYLATQAIADFLASDERTVVDGILFPSAQVKGPMNVVLFQKASRVAKIDLPPQTKVTVSAGHWEGEDEFVSDLRVIEEVPTFKPRKKAAVNWPMFGLSQDQARRPVTLAVDLDAIEVRHVSGVSFQTSTERAKRERLKREPVPRKPPF